MQRAARYSLPLVQIDRAIIVPLVSLPNAQAPVFADSLQAPCISCKKATGGRSSWFRRRSLGGCRKKQPIYIIVVLSRRPVLRLSSSRLIFRAVPWAAISAIARYRHYCGTLSGKHCVTQQPPRPAWSCCWRNQGRSDCSDV